jgi:hypothetical protein
MRAFYKEGFMLFKSDKPGPVFIAPHSTVSLLSVSRGDVMSELVTSRLVKRIGGIGMISTVPRKGGYGIDYFREAASMEEAVSMFNAFESSDYDAMQEFEKKYSFFARDSEEYLEKMNAYNQFWTTVETLAPKKPFFVIIHTQAARMKNFPSLLDVATLSGKWMDERVAKETVEKVCISNKKLINSLKDELKKYSTYWAAIHLKSSILYRFKKFDVNCLKGSIRTELINDIKRAAKLLGKDYETLMKDLIWEKYIGIIQECIDNCDFAVTYQNTFDGRSGEKRIGRLLDKCGGSAVSLETSAFLNEIYPMISVKLVEDIINYIVRKEKLKGFEKFVRCDANEMH